MKVYFYKKDGSPVTTRSKTARGEYKEYHDYEIHDGSSWKEKEEVTFHTQYGRMETYVVEAIDAETALLRKVGSFYK